MGRINSVMGKVYGRIDGFLGSSWLKSSRKTVDNVMSSSVAKSMLNGQMGKSMLMYGGLGAAAGAGYSYASDGRVNASSMLRGAALGAAGRAGYGLYQSGLPGMARNAYNSARASVSNGWRNMGRRYAADNLRAAVARKPQLMLPANVESIPLGPSSVSRWGGRTSRRRGL